VGSAPGGCVLDTRQEYVSKILRGDPANRTPPGNMRATREVHPLLYAVAALFVIYFLRGPLESLIH
jgi:hypothetical protein